MNKLFFILTNWVNVGYAIFVRLVTGLDIASELSKALIQGGKGVSLAVLSGLTNRAPLYGGFYFLLRRFAMLATRQTQIINFWEAKRAIEMRELGAYLKQEYEERQGIEPPRKTAKIISAFPGETIPPEYFDLRPYMQRDGLILATWSTWVEDDLQNFKIHWIKSCGKLKKYSACWYVLNDMKNMLDTIPDRRGDRFYREGIRGNYYTSNQYVADTVFICAPELTVQTRPVFIEKLKETGVTVDFNFDFTLAYAKELEFKRQVEQIRSLGSEKITEGVSV
jgi:pentatricopeptide repeat protein